MLNAKAHAIESHLEAALLDFGSLGRILQQNGIGVVDVGIDGLRSLQRAEPGQAPSVARDRQVIHFPSAALADSKRHQLVVTPEGAVEQQKICVLKLSHELGIELPAAGYECHAPTGGLVFDDQSHRMTGFRVRSKSGRVTRYWKGCDCDPTECSVAVLELTPPMKAGLGHRDCCERAGDRQNIRRALQNVSDGSGCV